MATKKAKAAPKRPRNRKYQCNGPASWSRVFMESANRAIGSRKEGTGVRLALSIGVAQLASEYGLQRPTP